MNDFHPVLEALETRLCPATTVTVKEVTALVIKGDDAANAITVDDLGDGTLKVSVDGGAAMQYAHIGKLTIKSGLGDDAITYNLGTSPTRALKLTIDAGDGNDALTVNQTAALNRAGSGRKFNVLMGTGNDAITGTFAGVANAGLYFTAGLGAGDDVMDVTLTGSLTGNAIAGFSVVGDAGADGLHFHAMGINVANRAMLGFSVFGGADNDGMTFEQQGEVDGLCAAVFQGGQGDDIITATASLDTGSKGTFGGAVGGQKGNDVLTFNVQANDKDIAEVLAVLDGGKGQDKGISTGNVKSHSIEQGIPVP